MQHSICPHPSSTLHPFCYVNLRAETEPSELVGQFLPGEGRGADCISWQPGVVTRAFSTGGCLILTHLESGEMQAQLLFLSYRALLGATHMFPTGATKIHKHPLQLSCLCLPTTADAKVLERINPALEQPPTWVLTERGETQPIPQNATAPLQVVATLTPPCRHGSLEVGLQGSELSPALANRFTRVGGGAADQTCACAGRAQCSSHLHLIVISRL
jgi:midasin (ATPase involved in ribosome maturation)